jgi:hypothetical protein
MFRHIQQEDDLKVLGHKFSNLLKNGDNRIRLNSTIRSIIRTGLETKDRAPRAITCPARHSRSTNGTIAEELTSHETKIINSRTEAGRAEI